MNEKVTKEFLVPTKWTPVENVRAGDKIFRKGELHSITSIEKQENYSVFRVSFSGGDFIDATGSHKLALCV